MDRETKTAYIAAGCFWGPLKAFRIMNGIKDAVGGYMGGTHQNPTHDEVDRGRTDHFETVKVSYNPKQVAYSDLLDVFRKQLFEIPIKGLRTLIPLQPAIFYQKEEEKELAFSLLNELRQNGECLEWVTRIRILDAHNHKFWEEQNNETQHHPCSI